MQFVIFIDLMRDVCRLRTIEMKLNHTSIYHVTAYISLEEDNLCLNI